MKRLFVLALAVAAFGVVEGREAFTVGLRMRVAPFAPISTRAAMIAFRGSGYYDGYRLEAFPAQGGLRPALEIGQTGRAWMLEAPNDRILPPGSWNHLAATWDGKTARIFLNGEIVAEGVYDGAYVPPRKGAQLVFATRDSYGLDYYPFDREDLLNLDRALSPKDVRARVGAVEPPNAEAMAKQLQLYYRGLGLWHQPTEADREAIRKEWRERPVNPYGPAPDLPAANAPAAVAATRFYVAPDGRDENPGTLERPFRTLVRARDAIRALRAASGLPKGGVTVFVRGGTYPVTATVGLDAADSGEPGSPILYAAYGEERPVFSGGFEVRDFAPADSPRLPAAARGKALVANVRAQGFPHFEPVPSYGYEVGEYTGRRPLTDLYHDGVRQEPARWPNEGWNRILGGDITNNTVKVELDGWEKWRREPGLMITGYPSALWADLTCPVTGFDRERGEITVAGRPDGRRFSRLTAGHPWFFSNALCALDAPGEWYLDREAGLLYVMPDGREGPYALSCFSEPFFRLTGVHDVEIRGLTLECGRGDAVVGTKLRRVTFARNVIRGFGNDALHALESEGVTVADCTLRTFGHGAVRMSGGDRKTLRPAGNVVVGNDISDVEQRKRTYAPGLLLFGCGTRIERNRFHDMRSSAMRLEGNDFLVVSNLVEDVVLESDDQGGVDVYANSTYAMRFLDNVWRNIGRSDAVGTCGQAAIRFDDRVSNMIVAGNRFEHCSVGHFGAIQINGGRNNTIDRNVFVDCRLSLSIGRWPSDRWKKYVESRDGRRHMTQEVDIREEPYRSRYPGIDRLPEMDCENRFWRNKLYGDVLPPPRHGGLTDFRANCHYQLD